MIVFLTFLLVTSALSFILTNVGGQVFLPTDDFLAKPYIPRLKSIVLTIPPGLFTYPPRATITLLSFAFSTPQNAGINVFTSDVTTSSFRINLYAPIGSSVSFLKFWWMLTDEPHIRFFPISFFGDKVKNLKYGKGERKVTKKIEIPHSLRENGEIAVLLTGFQLKGDGDAILSVNGKKRNERQAEITFKTRGNSKMNFVSGIAIVYDKSLLYHRTFYKNLITNQGIISRNIPNNADVGRMFAGVNKFHFLSGYDINIDVIFVFNYYPTYIKIIPGYTTLGTTQAKLIGLSVLVPKT